VRIGGDVALLKGMMKHLVDADATAGEQGLAPILDWDFIRGHTQGIKALVADLQATRWDDIERMSGIPRADIEMAATAYMRAERAILVFGMGITQHRHGTRNVQQLAKSR
jgi:anaerobic selenocysteine-containing dehydrogenase